MFHLESRYMYSIIVRPHLFGGKSNNLDEIFIPIVIEVLNKYNNNCKIHFSPQNEKYNFPEIKNNNIFIYDTFTDLTTDKSDNFDNIYVHLSKNPFLFEKFAIKSYFYLLKLMEKYDYDKIICIETDMLCFENLNKIVEENFNISKFDAFLTYKNSLCFSFFTKTYLEHYVNVVIQYYTNSSMLNCIKQISEKMDKGGISDMFFNESIYNNHYGTKNNNNNEEIKIHNSEYILKNNILFTSSIAKNEYSYLFNIVNILTNDEKNILNYKFKTKEYEFINYENINRKFIMNDIIKCHKNELNYIDCPNIYFITDTNELIKIGGIHFQGRYKEFIPIFYEKYIKN